MEKKYAAMIINGSCMHLEGLILLLQYKRLRISRPVHFGKLSHLHEVPIKDVFLTVNTCSAVQLLIGLYAFYLTVASSRCFQDEFSSKYIVMLRSLPSLEYFELAQS
jgi:hypothetical protein